MATVSRRRFLFKGLIAALLLVWLVSSDRLVPSNLTPLLLSPVHALGIGALLVNVILQSMRWQLLLRTQAIELSFVRSLQLTWMAQFFSIFLPGSAGGELIRAYYITGHKSADRMSAVSTIVIDRALGLYALLWLGIPGVSVLWGKTQVSPGILYIQAAIIAALAFASLAVLILLTHTGHNRLIGLLPARFHSLLTAVLRAYHLHLREMALAFILSLLAGAVLLCAFRIAGQIVAASSAWWEIFLTGPLIIVANTLPLAPGGLGVGETTASILFNQFNVETGATMMLIVRMWGMIFRLPGGLIYIFCSRST